MSCVYMFLYVLYVCIPRSFLVINVCNQGKTLRSHCIVNNATEYQECHLESAVPRLEETIH
jgi:hypothetical protein